MSGGALAWAAGSSQPFEKIVWLKSAVPQPATMCHQFKVGDKLSPPLAEDARFSSPEVPESSCRIEAKGALMKKKQEISLVRSSAAEYLTFVAASGQGGVEAIYAGEGIWLTQKMMGLLYDVETHIINYHLKKVFADSELEEGSVIRKFRITAADGKSYHNAYLDVAEDMAQRKIPMTMQDWETRLNRFIEATDHSVLQDAGKVTAEIAKAHAESEFEKYRIVQDRLFESDFDRMVKAVGKLEQTGRQLEGKGRGKKK